MAKFAVAGTVIGVGAGMAADYINIAVLNPILKPTSQTQPTQAGMVGRMAFQVVAGSLVAGAVIYAGDKLMDYFVEGTDPLYRTFYTLTAFNSMRLISQNMNNVSGIYGMGVNMLKPTAPVPAATMTSTKAVQQPPGPTGKPCCGK